MGANKVIGKIFASIFTIIFAILCLSFVYVFMVRNLATYENVSNYVSDANIFDCSSYEVLPRKDASTLREAIGKDLFEIGIPRLVVDDILDSDEVHKIITDYTYGYVRYVVYNESKPMFSTDDFVKVVENKYFLSTKKRLSEDQKTEVTKYVIEFSAKLDKGTFDKSELNEIVNIDTIRVLLTSVSSKLAIIVLSLVLLFMLVLVSICLLNIVKGIRWCAKAILVDGILLIVTSLLEVRVLIMFINSKGIVDSLLISVIENQFGNLIICGAIFIIVGVIFLIITGVLLKKQHNKNSDAILDNVIANEVSEVTPGYEDQIVEPVNNVEDVPAEETNEPEVSDSAVIEPQKDENEVTSQMEEPVGVADAVSHDNEVQTDIHEDVEINPEPVSEPIIEEPVQETSKIEENKSEVQDSFDLMEIVDVQEDVSADINDNNEQEKDLEVAIETPVMPEEASVNTSEATGEYTEISDDAPNPIVKEDNIKVMEPSRVELNVIHPVRGEDIKVDVNEEEEDIEIL